MTLNIKILDVGLGTSVLIETDEINIIFDCGKNSETGNNAFKELKGKSLNYLILTHPHKDHIEALDTDDYAKPKQLTRNENIPKHLIEEQIQKANESDKGAFRKYKELNNRYVTPSLQSYSNPDNNGNVDMNHFVPSKQNSDELNDYSIATYLSYNGHRILLMGDNTPSNIEELMKNNDFKNKIKNIDVLLAPHHGRESCYVQEFVKHLNPKITIISDKPEDNDESARSKYEYYSDGMNIRKNGKSVFRKSLTTRNDGDITLTIDNYKNLSIICNK